MRIVYWISTSIAAILTISGVFIVGRTAWGIANYEEIQFVVPIMPLGLGAILIGLLLFLCTRPKDDFEHLAVKALLHATVGIGLILFWWALIELPKITHQDIWDACRSVVKEHELRQCYAKFVLQR